MKKCNFCNRWFKNNQAVRAHLKHCPFYKHKEKSRVLYCPNCFSRFRVKDYNKRYSCPKCHIILETNISS